MGLFDTAIGLTPYGVAMGKGPIADALGLSGAQGDYFRPQHTNVALQRVNERQGIFGNDGVNAGLSNYGQGKMSLADALNAPGLTGQARDAYADELATNAQTGSRFATEQVDNNPLLSRVIGSNKDSLMSRTLADEKNLSERGYSLQPEDYEAYGQAQNNIARQFGQQESQAAKSLASRGLASSASGAAGSLYSGLQGNKMEQLKNAQVQIADKRMQNTLQRLNSARSLASTLGEQSATAINQQFNRQLAGVQSKRDDFMNAARATSQDNESNNKYDYLSQQDKRDAKGHTLLESFGLGLQNSAANVGAAPGKAASSAIGKGLGA